MRYPSDLPHFQLHSCTWACSVCFSGCPRTEIIPPWPCSAFSVSLTTEAVVKKCASHPPVFMIHTQAWPNLPTWGRSSWGCVHEGKPIGLGPYWATSMPLLSSALYQCLYHVSSERVNSLFVKLKGALESIVSSDTNRDWKCCVMPGVSVALYRNTSQNKSCVTFLSAREISQSSLVSLIVMPKVQLLHYSFIRSCMHACTTYFYVPPLCWNPDYHI